MENKKPPLFDFFSTYADDLRVSAASYSERGSIDKSISKASFATLTRPHGRKSVCLHHTPGLGEVATLMSHDDSKRV
jgi:hypothetical protein